MRKLYKYLPLFLQHLLLTLKNNQTYYLKYGAIPFIRPLDKVIEKIRNNDSLQINDGETITRIQSLFNDAVQNTKFYNDKSEIYLTNSGSLDTFKDIPILKKQTLRTNINDFISKKSTPNNSYAFKTSGTTGAPLKGQISNNDIRFRFEVFIKSLLQFGIDYSRPVARFSGAEIGDNKNIYRKDFFNNHIFVSIYHLSADNIHKYAEALNKNKIELLEGYPSTLYSMAKLFEQNNIICPTVKYVLTTAEKLLPMQKETLERVFNTIVFDYYGSSEGSSFIFTCKEGKYHNANQLSYLEVVDENYNASSLGQEGRMLVTSFSSHFTPLIRYDIGDRCVLSTNQDCRCGIGGIVIDEIIGRDDDIFITPDGRRFSRFSLCLKYLPEYIIRSQLHLKQNSYNVNVLLEETKTKPLFQADDFKAFESKFESMLGVGYKFEYKFVKEFPLNANGKLKIVFIDEN